MKHFVIVCDGMEASLFQKLSLSPELEVYPKSKVDFNELMEQIARAEAIVIRSKTIVDKNLLSRAVNLKYVIRAGEGTDNIDKEACALQNVKVSNTPGANNNSAAEHAVALMLSTLRKVPAATSSMLNKKWEKSSFVGNELLEKKVGIIGFGRIGQIVAKRISGFETKTFFYDPFIENFDGVSKIDNLSEMFATCDILTVHVPLNKHTKNLITKDLLDLMPAHAILINASRGGIVNEEDLFDVLKNKKIKAAALDVFQTEPLETNSRLLDLDNIVLTPHLGASTEEAQFRVGKMVIRQLEVFFSEGSKVENEVLI